MTQRLCGEGSDICRSRKTGPRISGGSTSVAADKCGLKTVNNDTISDIGKHPFKFSIFTYNFRIFTLFRQSFWRMYKHLKGLTIPMTYKYQGKYLTDFITVELVVELFAGTDDVPVEDICDAVDKTHVSRGGKHKIFDSSSYHPVSKATYVLKRMGFASNKRRRGDWSFDSVDAMINRLESLK